MNTREQYSPGPAAGAEIQKHGDDWTLVIVRELNHPPERVWEALTDPAQLREWAPFDADKNMGAAGTAVKLTTVGAPSPHVTETIVARAEEPRVLEYQWGGGDTRWELQPTAQGTRLTLWAKIDKRYIAMGAAGWHICLDALDRLVGGKPIGRHVGMEMMKFEGWQRLNKEYSEQFGIKASSR